MTKEELKTVIEDLIVSGELSKAIELIVKSSKNLNNVIYRNALNLAGRYKHLRDKELNNLIASSDADLSRDKIRYDLIQTINGIDNKKDYKVLEKVEKLNAEKDHKLLYFIGGLILSLLSCILLLTVVGFCNLHDNDELSQSTNINKTIPGGEEDTKHVYSGSSSEDKWLIGAKYKDTLFSEIVNAVNQSEPVLNGYHKNNVFKDVKNVYIFFDTPKCALLKQRIQLILSIEDITEYEFKYRWIMSEVTNLSETPDRTYNWEGAVSKTKTVSINNRGIYKLLLFLNSEAVKDLPQKITSRLFYLDISVKNISANSISFLDRKEITFVCDSNNEDSVVLQLTSGKCIAFNGLIDNNSKLSALNELSVDWNDSWDEVELTGKYTDVARHREIYKPALNLFEKIYIQDKKEGESGPKYNIVGRLLNLCK